LKGKLFFGQDVSECLLDNSGNRDTVSELDMSELTECRKRLWFLRSVRMRV